MKRCMIFGVAALAFLCFCRQVRKIGLTDSIPKSGTVRQVTLVHPGFRAASSAVIRLNSAELAVVFMGSAESAGSQRGKAVFFSRSADGGRNWSEPRSILAGTRGFEHPALFQLPGGRLVLTFGWPAAAPDALSPPDAGFFVCFSHDSGITFTTPRLIRVPKADWIETSDGMHVLEDGTLLAPLTAGRRNGAASILMAVSKDEGERWDKFVNVSGDSIKGASFRKPALARLPGRRLLCLMEGAAEDPYLYSTRSADDGATWEKPRNTGVQGKEPVLAVTSGGTLVGMFRDRWPQGISMVRSHDLGVSWEDETQVLGPDARSSSPHLTVLPGDVLLASYKCTEQDGNTAVKGLLFAAGPPPAPGGLSGSFKRDGTIHLRWNAVKQAVYYIITREPPAASSAAGDTASASGILGTSVEPRFIDRGADTLKTYHYRVSAVRTSGRPVQGTGAESDPSPAVTVKYR
jgi:hypothetical protein